MLPVHPFYSSFLIGQIAIQLIYSMDQFLQRIFDDIREWYDFYVVSFNVTEGRANQTIDSIDQYETAARGNYH